MDVRQFIVSLGGVTRVAAAMAIGQPAVSNWISAGRIPMAHYFRLRELALANHLEMDDGLFAVTARYRPKPAAHGLLRTGIEIPNSKKSTP